jgi:hypothetical protein
MWIYRTSGDSKTPIAIYEYQPDRKGEHPKNFPSKFRGFCHTDGFSGYRNLENSLENITLVGCWAHARRKFNDAYKITKAEGTPAKIGLDYCNELFRLERKFADDFTKEFTTTEGQRNSPDKWHAARKNFRLKHSKPLTEEFFAWANTVFVAPKTATHTAITYLLNQRKWLENIFLDGRLEISNNRAERTIKPFVMGRKNWLFSNSVSWAKASAMVFSIIETAKENGLNPFEYLKFLLEKLPRTLLSRIDGLMPWNKALPESCYAPK